MFRVGDVSTQVRSVAEIVYQCFLAAVAGSLQTLTRALFACVLFMTFPDTIPELPQAWAWPVNLLAAYDALAEIYQHALRAWDQEDADPLHLNYHLGSLEGDATQLLGAIKEDPVGSKLTEWLVQTAELIERLHTSIVSYRDGIQNQYINKKSIYWC